MRLGPIAREYPVETAEGDIGTQTWERPGARGALIIDQGHRGECPRLVDTASSSSGHSAAWCKRFNDLSDADLWTLHPGVDVDRFDVPSTRGAGPLTVVSAEATSW
jgi:hypothetical protein